MLKTLLDKLSGNRQTTEPETDTSDDIHVAFTALLVEAARGDQDYTGVESNLIDILVQRQFDLDETTARAIRAKAEEAQANANDLYQFSSVVKNGFSLEEKIELIEAMWEIIISDDVIDPYEEMIVRRLIGLIHLSDQESNAARRRIQVRRNCS